ncbi:DNA-binding transcriptional regulator Nlp [compost metagenome]
MNKAEIPNDLIQRWEWIKYQLRAKGSSLAKLARELNVTGPAVKNAKRKPYPRVERAIARALDTTPDKLWPERWNSDGTPHRQRPRRAEQRGKSPTQDNRYCPVPHRKTGTGA